MIHFFSIFLENKEKYQQLDVSVSHFFVTNLNDGIVNKI